MKPLTEIEKRKERHLRLSLDENVQSDLGTGFEDVRLIHRALPEIDLDEIDTETELFGKSLASPLIVSAITGGTGFAKEINSTLAEVAEELGLGIGVGSQRIALEDPGVEHTFTVVREKAPSALVMGNIGCPQLSIGWDVKEAKRCIDMIGADALGIHMNPLQEAVQLGGDTQYNGVLKKIKAITGELGTPVVMKETGAGISREVAASLEAAVLSPRSSITPSMWTRYSLVARMSVMGEVSRAMSFLALARTDGVKDLPPKSASMLQALLGTGPAEPKAVRNSLPGRASTPTLTWARSSPLQRMSLT